MAFSNDATSLDDDFWDRKNLGGVNCSGLFTSYLTTSNVTVQKFGTSRGAVGPPWWWSWRFQTHPRRLDGRAAMMIMTVLPQIFKSSPGARTGVRPPNPTFNTSFEIVRPSPSLLEHPQALSGPNKRTVRGGGRGTWKLFTILDFYNWQNLGFFCVGRLKVTRCPKPNKIDSIPV